MKARIFKVIAQLILVSVLLAPFGRMPAQGSADSTASVPVKHTLGVSETGLYIIRLQDPSLAAYRGGVYGLRATSPEITGARRLDSSTADSLAYLDYLSAQQGELLRNMSRAFSRPVAAVHQYKNVLNAVAVQLDHSEALQAFRLPGVLDVYPDKVRHLDTDAGPTLIGAPSIWTGATLDGSSTYGEGITIGVIDSGINHAHPSFADLGNDGYDHTNPYGAGNYVGVCDTDPAYADFCNDKLIGAYDMTGSGGPEDEDGHGSHTASTAAGNFVEVTFDDGAGGTFTANISGVAPHANVIAYRVCDDAGGCWSSATVAAVDHAVEDLVDVLNYSISGSDDPWADAVDLAFLDAFTAGIFVSASAGNDGPDPGTVAKTGPWNAAVAASTHNRIIAHPLDVFTDGASLLDLGAVEGSGPALAADFTDSLLYGGDVDPANITGCNAWAPGSFSGVIGMVQRGECTFAVKVGNLTAAGAVGALVYNNVGGPPTVMGGLEATTIPSMMISLEQGLDVVALITGDASAQTTMYVAQALVTDNSWADIMAGFSSRGPSQWDLLKPDYTAPGVNILAAVAAYGGDAVQYGFYQGTSMASPHGAGSAALLMALHPEWSPAAVKSAIAATADQGVLEVDAVTPADPFDMGSGRIDLSAAALAGFVMDETSANYIAANPYLGGEPGTLNQPSMVENTCISSCTWTRTIESTLDYAQEWQVSFSSQPEMTLSAPVMNFTLAAGGTQTIEVTASLSGAAPDTYYFGDVFLTPVGNAGVSTAHLTVAAQIAVSNLPDHLDILTDQLSGTVTLTDVQSSLMIADLWIEISGLKRGDVHSFDLSQDPTNGDPFDTLSQIFYTTISVPANSERLVAEIVESEAPDIDLFIGTGGTPKANTVVCTSATGVWAEYCNIDNPSPGTYWVLVQNWQGSTDQPDAIKAITAVVTNDESNLTITGTSKAVPALKYFDLDVSWDEPSMVLGDYWYAQFSVGTEEASAGNLGAVNVDLEYKELIYAASLAPDTQDGYGDPGTTVAHALSLTNLGNAPDTYNLSFADNTWVVALSNGSITLSAGQSVNILVNVTVPADALAGAMDSATITAVSTSDPAVTLDAVVTTYANTVHALDLDPASDSGEGAPGELVIYWLRLANLGNTAETITFSASGGTWDASLPTGSFNLAPGVRMYIAFGVAIPTDAEDGDSDTVTITAVSEDGAEASSNLTTTAVIEQESEYFIHLPFIFQN